MRIHYLLPFLIILPLLSCRKDNKAALEYAEHKFDFSSEWTYRSYYEYTYYETTVTLDTNRFWFDGDTIMERFTRSGLHETSATSSSYRYHILKHQSIRYINPEDNTTPFVAESIRGYIREDAENDRYYITYIETPTSYNWEYLAENEEVLLWDFGINEGDSMNWGRWRHVQEGNAWLALGKDSIYAGGYQFDKLNLHNSSYLPTIHTTVLKGIGSIHGMDRLNQNTSLIHYHCDNFDYYP